MKQHTAKRTLFALLFSLMLVLLAMPGMAFAVSGTTDVASVKVGSGSATTYGTGGSDKYAYETAEAALQAAVDAANDEQTDAVTIELLKDVDTTATLAITNASKAVTLDLSTYTIDATGSNSSVITVSNGANFTLDGTTGTITGGNAEKGGGVYVADGTFTMEGGTITENTATSGGGVYVDNGGNSFTMSGGTITKNDATNGGGVYMTGGASSFTMSGGTITDNDATNGGGVYMKKGTFTLDAGTTIDITDNTTGGNVYLASGKTITVASAPTTGSSIGITLETGTGKITSAGTAATGVFFADNTDYSVNESESSGNYTYKLIEAVASVEVGTYINYYATIEEAVSAAIDAGTSENATIQLLDNVTTSGTLTFKKSSYVTLDLNGYGITNDGSSSVITVSGSGTNFTLKDSGSTAVNSVTVNEQQVEVTGGYITGGSADNGGGVYVDSGGNSFTMSGGTIIGNTATNGGGVYVTGGASSFTMTGGTISTNSATDGGGVYMYNGTFAMTGGEISGNTATGNGSGVYRDSKGDGATTLGGSAVINNSIYLASGKTITVQNDFVGTGSSIGVTLGTADGTGAITSAGAQATDVFSADGDYYVAVAVSGGEYTYSLVSKADKVASVATTDGALSYYASLEGETGAVAAANAAESNATIQLLADVTTAATLEFTNTVVAITLDLNDKSITNTSTSYAITVTDANLTLTDDSEGEGGTITSTNTTNDATVKVTSGSFTMAGGSITGNVSYSNGAGVYVASGSTFTMTGGSITNNHADVAYGGGVYVAGGATFTMAGGSITNNIADGSGDGVYVARGATFKISGAPSIAANGTDNTSGDGVCLASGASITVTGELTTGASIVVTTETTPTTAASAVAVVVADAGYTLTEEDYDAFTCTNATGDVSFVLAPDADVIYLAVAPTLTIGLDETTTSTRVVFTLATDIEAYTYTAYLFDAEQQGRPFETGIFAVTEAGVYLVTVTDTTTGLTTTGAAPVYTATFDYADDMLVGGLLQQGGNGYSYPATFTMPAAPSSSGYIFMGWFSGTSTYAAGQTVSITGDTDFVAVWAADGTATVTTYYIIGLGTNGYGSIAPVVDGYDYALVKEGDAAIFSFVPMDGYEVYEVYIDGVAIGAQSFYSITSASANMGIYVEFAPEGTLALKAAATAGSTAAGTSPTTGDPNATDDTVTGSTTADSTTADDTATAPEADADDAADAADSAADSAADAVQVVASTASGKYTVFAVAVFALAALGGACYLIVKNRVVDED